MKSVNAILLGSLLFFGSYSHAVGSLAASEVAPDELIRTAWEGDYKVKVLPFPVPFTVGIRIIFLDHKSALKEFLYFHHSRGPVGFIINMVDGGCRLTLRALALNSDPTKDPGVISIFPCESDVGTELRLENDRSPRPTDRQIQVKQMEFSEDGKHLHIIAQFHGLEITYELHKVLDVDASVFSSRDRMHAWVRQ